MTIKTLAIAGAVTLAAGGLHAQETLEMTSSFGKNLPILGTAGVDFVEKINSIS